MAHVPYDFILGRIEHVMKGDGQLDCTKTGSQVSPVLGNDVHDDFSDFFGKN
jgi:hypothetical protein